MALLSHHQPRIGNGHAPPMHATPRIAPHPRLHSIPKRSRPDPGGSVQLTESVMLIHDGYDPVR
jgi:hypothetical protein